MKLGYKVSIVTGYDEARDIQVNPQLNVYFLKVFKAPVVKSFMFAASSLRKLNRVRDTANVDITHVNLPLVPNFAVPARLRKNFGFHGAFDVEG